MGKEENPTIRILLLGAPGVGKNCLESRFTTSTFPPPYDSALTLNSRRFLSLSSGGGGVSRAHTSLEGPDDHHDQNSEGGVTRRLDTSDGLRPHLLEEIRAQEGPKQGDDRDDDDDDGDDDDVDAIRPVTASSVYSNPASQCRHTLEGDESTHVLPVPTTTTAENGAQRGGEGRGGAATSPVAGQGVVVPTTAGPAPPTSPTAAVLTSPDMFSSTAHHRRSSSSASASASSASSPWPETDGDDVCSDCTREAGTFLVEVINDPQLRLQRERRAVLARGDFDAVILVYDVADRGSLEAATALHAEVMAATKVHSGISRRRRKQQQKHQTKATLPSSSSTTTTTSSSGWIPPLGREEDETTTNLGGGGGPIVALVANKADIDCEDFADVEVGYAEADADVLDREGERQAREVDAWSRVHPLFRRSRTHEDAPLSPRSLGRVGSTTRSSSRPDDILLLLSDGRRSAMSLDRHRHHHHVTPLGLGPGRQLVKSKSVQGIRASRDAGFATGSGALLLPEERPNRLPRRAASKRELVNSWLETGTPTRDHFPDGCLSLREDAEDAITGGTAGRARRQERTTHASSSSQPLVKKKEKTVTPAPVVVAAARRQVSRVEGAALAQRLGIRMPFLETSAKTGDNVEEVFETVVRRALRAMGRLDIDDVPGSPVVELPPVAPAGRRRRRRRHCRNKSHGSASGSARNSRLGGSSTSAGGQSNTSGSSPVDSTEEELWPRIPGSPGVAMPPATQPKRERRESMLRRVSSMFFSKRKQQPMMADVSA